MPSSTHGLVTCTPDRSPASRLRRPAPPPAQFLLDIINEYNTAGALASMDVEDDSGAGPSAAEGAGAQHGGDDAELGDDGDEEGEELLEDDEGGDEAAANAQGVADKSAAAGTSS